MLSILLKYTYTFVYMFTYWHVSIYKHVQINVFEIFNGTHCIWLILFLLNIKIKFF